MTSIYDVIPAQQIEAFKRQGYTEEDIGDAYNSSVSQDSLQSSYANAVALQSQDVRSMSNPTMVSSNPLQDNLIKWQLELDSILERIEHMLRGDHPKWVNGSMIFVSAEDDKDKILNDFGVAEVMRILSMYLNRNTILSNYDEDTINWKVLDFGLEVTDLFYLKYESMGLNSLEKRKLYPILVKELVDTVHSGYLRALNGGERDSLRTARQLTQSETLMPGMNFNIGGGSEKRSVLNPMRYFSGKYK